MSQSRLGKDAILVPIGTTPERPSSPEAGEIRFNTDLDTFEGYDGTQWLNDLNSVQFLRSDTSGTLNGDLNVAGSLNVGEEGKTPNDAIRVSQTYPVFDGDFEFNEGPIVFPLNKIMRNSTFSRIRGVTQFRYNTASSSSGRFVISPVSLEDIFDDIYPLDDHNLQIEIRGTIFESQTGTGNRYRTASFVFHPATNNLPAYFGVDSMGSHFRGSFRIENYSGDDRGFNKPDINHLSYLANTGGASSTRDPVIICDYEIKLITRSLDHEDILNRVQTNGNFVKYFNFTSGIPDFQGRPDDFTGIEYMANVVFKDVDVLGSLSKSSGSFKIHHPLPEKKDSHYLVHSFVESPRADNVYRGVATLSDGTAQINLDNYVGMTEGTFSALNGNPQIFLQNESGFEPVKGHVTDNILHIQCRDETATDIISWMVVAERQDQHMLDTEWTDEFGRPVLEPEKNPDIEEEELDSDGEVIEDDGEVIEE